MGCETNITRYQMPKQGDHLGKGVSVCFHYDTKNAIGGIIVRDDIEAPFKTIIKLENGNYVLASECQYCVP